MDIKKVLQDSRLSCKAKGIASIIELLGVEPNPRELIRWVKEGEFAIHAALFELAEHDYINFKTNRAIDRYLPRSVDKNYTIEE